MTTLTGVPVVGGPFDAEAARTQAKDLLQKLSTWIDQLATAIAALKDSVWTQVAGIGSWLTEVVKLGEELLRGARGLLEEAWVVPFALVNDIGLWMQIQHRAQNIQNHTTERAIDRNVARRGEATDKPWAGHLYDAYTSEIPIQNGAIRNVSTLAEKAANSLAVCFAAGITMYATWLSAVYQAATFLIRLRLNPTLITSGSDYSTFGRLIVTATAATYAANQAIAAQASRLATLAADRDGLTQPDQPQPGHLGADANWPNPFNDRSFVRVKLDPSGRRVRVEGGPEYSINKIP
ncbi:hypothetical protein GCM10022225_17660 [Plantactinospora mayteni]|uniref:Uncharacterized protein n=1 Tax=Plantactinospora mayteni TaxID=566021 RepID=A0ABQ4EGI4_9ACTN|nr:hypothetical protein [Plantactinospora mayteni]GIG93840.1 hypothetical protein Pma05_04130 [Plantactinospora mayteni]